MFVIKHRSFFFWLTGLFLVAAIASLVVFRLPLSIEFTGGSLVEVAYTAERPSSTALHDAAVSAGFADVSVRESGDNGIVVRTKTLTPAEHETLLGVLSVGSTTPL